MQALFMLGKEIGSQFKENQAAIRGPSDERWVNRGKVSKMEGYSAMDEGTARQFRQYGRKDLLSLSKGESPLTLTNNGRRWTLGPLLQTTVGVEKR